MHLRVARHTERLEQVVGFYRDGRVVVPAHWEASRPGS
jgi:hypothetical protein